MSDKSINFIFCPICGGVKWITDKTGYANNGRLTYHKCAACKKFSYTNHTKLVDHPILIGVTHTTGYEVVANIESYNIRVNYHNNTTQFTNINTTKLILEVNTAVKFNWYKNEELIKKIKMYVIFS